MASSGVLPSEDENAGYVGQVTSVVKWIINQRDMWCSKAKINNVILNISETLQVHKPYYFILR